MKIWNKPIWRFLALRLCEAGTWRGILLVLIACRIKIAPEEWAHIVDAGMAVATAAQLLLPELGSPVAVAQPAPQPLPPGGTAPGAATIPVSIVGEHP